MDEVLILAPKEYETKFKEINNIYLGFDRFYDLIKFILTAIPFKYKLVFHGSSRRGVLKNIQLGYADVGLGIFQPAKDYVGFSMPFSYTYVSIMSSNPPVNPVPLFYGVDHIKPLAYPLIIGCILAFALFLKINNRLIENRVNKRFQPGIADYVYEIIGTLFLKSFEKVPANFSGQLAIGSWILLIFVFSSTYLAFMKSSYSVSMTYPINSFEDLLKYPNLTIMVAKGGWAERHFQNCKSTDIVCKNIAPRISTDFEIPIGNFSYPALHAYNRTFVKGCVVIADLYGLSNTMRILSVIGYSKPLFCGSKHYYATPEGIALSPYARQDIKEYFNSRILRFFETQQEYVSILYHKNKKIQNSDYPTASKEGFMVLSVKHFKPLAIILLLGLAVSLAVLTVEIIIGLLRK